MIIPGLQQAGNMVLQAAGMNASKPGGLRGLLGTIGNIGTQIGNRFTGALMPQTELSGLLSPDEQRNARNAALLHFGASMLNSAGPTTGVAPSLGQAFGNAMLAGQQGYQGSVQGAVGDAQMAAQIRQQQEEQQRLADWRSRYGGGAAAPAMPAPPQKRPVAPGMAPQGPQATPAGVQAAPSLLEGAAPPSGPQAGLLGPEQQAVAPGGPVQAPAQAQVAPTQPDMAGQVAPQVPNVPQVADPMKAAAKAMANRTPTPEEAHNQQVRNMLQDLVGQGMFREAAQLGAALPYLMQEPQGPGQFVPLGDRVRQFLPNGQFVDHPVGYSPNSAANRGDHLTRGQRLAAERALRNDFAKEVADWREGITLIDGALAVEDKALNGDPAAVTNMLYAFVKAMDPNSAVREGEIHLVRAASSWRQEAQRWYDQIMSGGATSGMVPRDFIAQMGELMAQRREYFAENINESVQFYDALAKEDGLRTGMFRGARPNPRQAAPADSASADPASIVYKALGRDGSKQNTPPPDRQYQLDMSKLKP